MAARHQNKHKKNTNMHPEITWQFHYTVGNKPRPKITLATKEETLAYLANPPTFEACTDQYAVCSLYLCDFLDGLEASGYVYNEPAQRAFESVHGLPASKASGTTLSVLIYNCQGYRRARAVEMAGWEPCTPEVLEHAAKTKQKLVFYGSNCFGSPVQEAFVVRFDKNGIARAHRPRERKARAVGGLPCKLIAA